MQILFVWNWFQNISDSISKSYERQVIIKINCLQRMIQVASIEQLAE